MLRSKQGTATLSGSHQQEPPSLVGRARPSLSAVLFVLAAALVIRVVCWQQTPMIGTDSYRFLAAAEAMEAGDYDTALRDSYHPMTAWLICQANVVQRSIFGDPADFCAEQRSRERAAHVVIIFAGVLTVLLTMSLSFLLFPGVSPIWVGWLAATQPYLVRSSADIMSDTIFLAFFVAALELGARVVGAVRRWPLAALAGVAAGLAYWTRPEALVLGIGLPLYWLLRRRPTLASTVGLVLLFAVSFAAVAAPYVVEVSKIAGQPTVSLKKDVRELSSLPQRVDPDQPRSATTSAPTSARPTEIDAEPSGSTPLENVAATSPQREPQDVPEVLPRPAVATEDSRAVPATDESRSPDGDRGASGAPSETAASQTAASQIRPRAMDRQTEPAAASVPYAAALGRVVQRWFTTAPEYVAVFVVIGFAVVLSSRRSRNGLLLPCFVGGTAVAVLVLLVVREQYLSRRHVLTLVLLSLPLAAVGVGFAGRQLGRLLRLSSPSRAAVVLFVALIAVLTVKGVRPQRDDQLAQQTAAEWIRAEYGRGVTIFTDREKVSYYAGGAVRQFSAMGPVSVARAAEVPDSLVVFYAEDVGCIELQVTLDKPGSRFEQVGEFREQHSKRPRTLLVYAQRRSTSE